MKAVMHVLNPATGVLTDPRPRRIAASTSPSEGFRSKVPHVLTVAGSDSGAGAGIQADIKACAAAGSYCSSIVTAVTAQNSVGVQGVHPVPEEFVWEQLRSVLSDMEIDVVKTGMIPSVSVLKILCQALKDFPVKGLVVDPVMVSTSGDMLASSFTLTGFRNELLPMADLVTPNLDEASALLGGMPVKTVADMHSAARTIHTFGPRNVLVKGGHLLDNSESIDVFFNGDQCHELYGSRIETRNTHGTGCSLASYIAAELAKGSAMLEAVQAAKNFVERALCYSKDLVIGKGPQGHFDHFFKLIDHDRYAGCNPRFDANSLLLYAITDPGMNKRWGRSSSDAVKAAIKGGATIVQLSNQTRVKDTDTLQFVEEAKACMEICRSYGVPLLINDRVDVALASGADGVHVGQSDMPVTIVRKILGPEKIIGVSCKTPDQAQQAWSAGADYIGCGGVFATTTKANNITIGIDGLKSICLSSKLPVVAIGGINSANARAVLDISLRYLKGVAVVSALFDRECITSGARELRSVLMDHRVCAQYK